MGQRTNIRIHRINKNDLQKLVVLWNQERNLLTSSKFKMTEEKALDGFVKKMFDYFGLYDGTELIGFILVNENNSDTWLKHMVVDKKFRSSGLGSYFLNEVLKQYGKSEKLYRTEVLLDNYPAKQFFERNGFKVEKEDTENGQFILTKQLLS